jgi:hypothetical protein
MARRKKQPAVLLLEEDEEDEEDKCEGGGASDADEEEDGSVVSRVLEVIGTIGKYKRRRQGVIRQIAGRKRRLRSFEAARFFSARILESYDSKLKLLTEVFAFGLPAQPKPTRESKQLHCDRSAAAAAAAASFSEKLGVSVTRPRQLAS